MVKVFISYRHESDAKYPEHQLRVRRLGEALRNAKCEVILDQFFQDANPGGPNEQWPKWCENQVPLADKVLMVASPGYFRCYEQKELPGTGLGAACETTVIRNVLFDCGYVTDKFRFVHFDKAHDLAIPAALKGIHRFNASDSADMASLISWLNGTTRHAIDQANFVEISNSVWTVPYRRNPFFTGRDDILDEIHGSIAHNGRTALRQTQAIHGLGGIGKTQTAVEYAYRHRSDFQAVLWITCDSEQEILNGFRDIAKRLNLLEAGDTQKNDSVALVLCWLESKTHWLLIFDNADNPAILERFLPNSDRGSILITSRASVFDSLHIKDPLDLTFFSSASSIEFLIRRTSHKPESAEETEALKAIAAELQGLPLALEQAGAYIAAKNTSFVSYITSYRNIGLPFLEKMRPAVGKYPKSVLTAWTLNFTEIQKSFSASAALLKVCAFLAAENIPEELFTLGHAHLGSEIDEMLTGINLQPTLIDEILEPLAKYSIIQRDKRSASFGIHRLVQAVLKENLLESERSQWAERTVRAVNQAFPSVNFAHTRACERLLAHALFATVYIEQFAFRFAQAGRLLNQVGLFLARRGQYDKAEQLYCRAILLLDQGQQPQKIDVAAALNNLGLLLYSKGDYRKAEEFLERDLSISEAILGSEHPEIAKTRNNLALVLMAQSHYTEAEELLLAALAHLRKTSRGNETLLATVVDNLGELYRARGVVGYKKAEPLLKEALALREAHLGSDDPDVATSLMNLVRLYRAQGRYSECEAMLLRALAILEANLPPDHPDIATCQEILAEVYRKNERFDEAITFFNCALCIYEKVLDSNNPSIAIILDNLAEICVTLGRYQEAKALAGRSLRILRKTLGEDHPDVLLELQKVRAIRRLINQNKWF